MSVEKPLFFQEIPTFGKKANAEIAITLFNDCNLNCKFCWGLSQTSPYFNEKAIVRMANDCCNVLCNVNEQKITVALMGGEVLQDKFTDEQFLVYEKFCDLVLETASEIGKTVRFTLASNLIFKKRERVLNLLKKYNFTINGSFDLVGRYDNPKLVSLFISNVDWLRDNGIDVGVSFVAHKSNIKALKNRESFIEEFDYLYNNYDMFFEYYTTVGVEEFDVTEEEVADFLKFLHIHYPKMKQVESFDQSFANKRCDCIECQRTVWISDYVDNCDGNFLENYKSVIQEKGCLSCKHLRYCVGVCSRIFKGNKFCFLRDYYDHLESLE